MEAGRSNSPGETLQPWRRCSNVLAGYTNGAYVNVDVDVDVNVTKGVSVCTYRYIYIHTYTGRSFRTFFIFVHFFQGRPPSAFLSFDLNQFPWPPHDERLGGLTGVTGWGSGHDFSFSSGDDLSFLSLFF